MTNNDIVQNLRDGLESDHRHVLTITRDSLQDVIDEIEYLRDELANANSEYNKLWSKHNFVMRDKIYPLDRNYTDFLPYSRSDRDRWKEVAESLARQLGKVEYAHTEYQDRL